MEPLRRQVRRDFARPARSGLPATVMIVSHSASSGSPCRLRERPPVTPRSGGRSPRLGISGRERSCSSSFSFNCPNVPCRPRSGRVRRLAGANDGYRQYGCLLGARLDALIYVELLFVPVIEVISKVRS